MSQIENAPYIILQKISKALSDLSIEDANKLEKNDYKAEIIVKRVRSSGNKDSSNMDKGELQTLVSKLEFTETRDDAVKLLAPYTKAILQEILEKIDVPCHKRDSKEILVEKIVENTIGFRLRSEAITKNG